MYLTVLGVQNILNKFKHVVFTVYRNEHSSVMRGTDFTASLSYV